MIRLIYIKNVAWIALLALLSISCVKKKELDANKFRKTLDKHLNAIMNRNLVKLRPTVADNVTLIFPDGSKGFDRE